jgi:plasmid stabilization system protein ParE
MTYRVIIESRAARDIENPARWVFQASKSKTAALRWVRGIRGEIETLGNNPW